MNDISDRSIMAALGRQLTMAVAKQTVTVGNLANLNTPGYKTQSVSFDSMLDAQVKGGPAMAVTQPGHLAGVASAASGGQVEEVKGLDTRRDGNNVVLDRELLNLSRASGDFSKAQIALAAKFRLVRYAISESR